MKLLTVDTIEEARQKILAFTRHWKLSIEKIELSQALGRILAEDIFTPDDIPNFRRSTVDGYAVQSKDTAGAGEALPVMLKLIGTVEIGKPAGFNIRSGECAYVPTGGMIPEGADAMVMVEYSEVFGDEIAIYGNAAPLSNLVSIGEDSPKGELLLHRGTKILSHETGALAAAGITQVPVYAPLRISILSSGDELVAPDKKPGLAEVRDINTSALGAIATESGFKIVVSKALKDDEKALEEAVRDAMLKSDVLVLSGGSSKGNKDLTAVILSRLAEPGIFTQGLAIKPGKPTILAYDKLTDTILAGLPGHPVSALIVFRVLLSWLIMQLTGQKEALPIPAKIGCNIANTQGRSSYQPVVINLQDGVLFAQPIFGKAGMISTLTKSDGYIIIDMNKEGIKEGDTVLVYLW